MDKHPLAASLLVILVIALLASCSGQTAAETPTQAPTPTAVASASPATAAPTETPVATASLTPAPTPTVREMATPGPEPTPRPKGMPLKEGDYIRLSIENRPMEELGDWDEIMSRVGMVNRYGVVILPPVFSYIEMFSKDDGTLSMFFAQNYDFAPYTEYDETGRKIPGKALQPSEYGCFYDPNGRLINNRKYIWAYKLNGQLIAARILNGKAGVMNYGLKQIIPFQYYNVIQMRRYIAAVGEKNGKYYIDFYDMNGRLTRRIGVASEYVCYSEYTSDDILLAQGLNEKFGFIDETLWWVETPNISIKKDEYQDDDSILYDTLEKYVSEKIKKPYSKLLPPGYDSIDPFTDEGGTQIKHNGKLLYIADWQDRENDVYYKNALIDETGKMLYETQIHYTIPGGSAYFFYPDGIILEDGKAYNFDGKELLPGIPGIIDYISEDKLFLSRTACYTADGRRLPLPPAQKIAYATMDRFIIITPDGKQGLCNGAGLWLLPPTDRFEFIPLELDAGWVGYEWQVIYQGHMVGEEDEYSTYGLVDENGRVLLEPIYDSVGEEGDGIYHVVFGNNDGYVDVQGNWIWRSTDYDRLID